MHQGHANDPFVLQECINAKKEYEFSHAERAKCPRYPKCQWQFISGASGQITTHQERDFPSDMLLCVHLHTLLFLHISEIFEREGPHRRSPESVGLHDRLQASPDRDTQKERNVHPPRQWRQIIDSEIHYCEKTKKSTPPLTNKLLIQFTHFQWCQQQVIGRNFRELELHLIVQVHLIKV